jgi:hypothetical protein
VVRVVARGSGGTAAVSGGGLAPAVVTAPKDRVRLGLLGGFVTADVEEVEGAVGQ